MSFELRKLALLTAVLAAAVLATAFGFQHLGGLDPCVLCVYQRWPWVAVIVLGVLASLAGGLICRGLVLLMVLALLAGAGIAGFHVGVEHHWWAGTAECGGQSAAEQSVEALKALLLATPVTRCDEVAWSLGGISMAGWNGIVSLGASLVLAGALSFSRKKEASR